MEGKASEGNLAISDPTAKMVLRSGIRFGRYRGATPHCRDPKSRRSKFKLIYTKKKTQGRSKVGGQLEAHNTEFKRNSE